MLKTYTIAIVEDEKKLAASLQEGLESERSTVRVFYDGISAEAGLIASPPDLVVLDLMLPGKDGFDVCATIRKAGVSAPVLVLTAKDSLEDKLKAFNCGADDFVTKPFSFEELLARVQALLRRTAPVLKKITLGDVTIDLAGRTVFRGPTEISLTFKEFELLEYLAQNEGVVKTREEIFSHLWSRKDDDASNVVDVHIKNLRKKLNDDHDQKIIRTIRGLGYATKG